jgi:hypothetical protein
LEIIDKKQIINNVFSFWNELSPNYQMIIIAFIIGLIFFFLRSIIKIIIGIILLILILKFGLKVDFLRNIK